MKQFTIDTPDLLNLKAKISAFGFDTSNISKAIAAYEKFLYIIKLNPSLKAVPTKEIDEVWHYHLSFPALYKKDCIKYFGRVIGHKQAITATELKENEENYIRTSEIWYSAFHGYYGSKEQMAICGVDGGDEGTVNDGKDH